MRAAVVLVIIVTLVGAGGWLSHTVSASVHNEWKAKIEKQNAAIRQRQAEDYKRSSQSNRVVMEDIARLRKELQADKRMIDAQPEQGKMKCDCSVQF